MIPLADLEQPLWLLIEWTLKTSVLVLLAMTLNRALRNASAAVRHALWAACVLSAVALPLFTFLLPAWHSYAGQAALSLVNRSAEQPAPNDGLIPFVISAAEAAQSILYPRLIVAVWACGAILYLFLIGAGLVRLLWTAGRARPLFVQRWMQLVAELSAQNGIRRPVRLLQSRTASMPVTWGVLKPQILLPSGAEHWTAEQMRIVLAHELAHIRRKDWLLQLLAELCRALYWFNPLIHVACDRLRRESEQACDDAVLNAGIDGTQYAEQLLALARSLPSAQRPWSVALAMARTSNLERRFIAMMNTAIPRHGLSRGTSILTFIATVAVVLPLAAWQTPAQAARAKYFGTVHDASGAAVPNATVIVSNRAANTRDMTATNDAGYFEFNGLSAGEHTVEILKPGFAKFVVEKLKLTSYGSESGKYTLSLGKITENVQVRGDGTPQQTSASSTGAPSRIRVGGNVQAAKLLNMVRPLYPQQARNAGIQGIVVLEAVISREGVPLSLRVANSQIDPDLARAAVEAVSQWRYQPTLLNGLPVEIATQVNVSFTLQP